MLNLGSLILGVGAWLFAVRAIAAPKARISHRNTVASFSLCTVSLVFQLWELTRRVGLRDYAAVEDTISAILTASAALVVVTMVLNLAAFVKAKNK